MDISSFGIVSHGPFLYSVTSPIRLSIVGTHVHFLWTFSGIVRSPLLNSPLGQSNLVGGTVYCLWTFSGIVPSPLSYTPLDQSNLVGTYVHCLWPFSGIVRHGLFLHSVTSPILPPVVGTHVYWLWPFFGIVRTPLLYTPLDQSNLIGTYVYCLWTFSGIVTARSYIAWRHRPFRRCRHLRAFPMDIFRHCSDAPFEYLSRPIKSCRYLRAFPMDVFRHCSVASFVLLKCRENPDALLLHNDVWNRFNVTNHYK